MPVQTEIEIRHLFISPGHNFVGHWGKAPAEYAALAVNEIECVAGKGIKGDRYFGFKKDYKGQITFFEEEVYEDLCSRLNMHHRGPDVFRRNVITRGTGLNDLIGAEFEIQGVRFFGKEECRPCGWMDYAFAPGAEEALKGRGGLRALILSSGTIQVSRSPVALAWERRE
jgi:MOSC domain-containing protein YiiM